MVANQANVLMYFMQAGLVVKSVMLILLIASIISWTLIFQRAWFFNRRKQMTETFTR
ncbi:TPA: protein TolQ, partial [Legionella pneumophila]